jgi:hypothetical protein
VRALNAVLVALALLTVGCAGSWNDAAFAGKQERAIASANLAGVAVVQPTPPTPRCISLDDGRRTWSAVAKGAAVIAGSSLLASWPVDDKTSRIVLLSTGTLVALVGGVAVYVSEDLGSTWVREGCGQ